MKLFKRKEEEPDPRAEQRERLEADEVDHWQDRIEDRIRRLQRRARIEERRVEE